MRILPRRRVLAVVIGLFLMVLALMPGCGRAATDKAAMEPGATQGAPMEIDAMSRAGADDGGSPGATQRRVHREARLSVTVDNLEGAVEDAGAIATRLGGFVAYSSVQVAGRNASVTLQVPEPKMTECLLLVKKLGRLTGQELSGEDMTEQYVDVEARLRNLKATEQRLIAILSRTGEIADVLATEKEISRVRGEIEVLETQLRNLDRMTSLATINVRFETDQPAAEISQGPGLGESPSLAVKGFVSSCRAILSGLVWLIVFLGKALPFLLLAGAVAAGLRLRRRLAKRKGESE